MKEKKTFKLLAINLVIEICEEKLRLIRNEQHERELFTTNGHSNLVYQEEYYLKSKLKNEKKFKKLEQELLKLN